MEKLKELSLLDWGTQLVIAWLLYSLFAGEWFNGILDRVLYYAYDYEKFGYGAIAVRFMLVASMALVLIIALGFVIDKFTKGKRP